MAKTQYLKVRMSGEEMAELERNAGMLGMQKSRLARMLLTTDQQQKAPESAPTGELADIKKTLDEQAAALADLLKFLGEQMRVPTFREYRSRLAAEGIDKRQNEDDLAFLIRSANLYFASFGVWPDPSQTASFGPVGKLDLSQFPRHP